MQLTSIARYLGKGEGRRGLLHFGNAVSFEDVEASGTQEVLQAGTLIPSAQRLVWAAKQALGNAALGALFA